MKIMFLALAFILPALAGDDAKTFRTLQEIQNEVADHVGNGDTDLTKYDIDNFHMGSEIRRLQREFRPGTHGDCRFDIIVGRRENLDFMKIARLNEDNKADALLQKLHQTGKIKTILSAQWDSNSGESEYCNIYTFEIYTVGGNLLTLNYELTD